MADAGARWHDAEVFKSALPPFQELVALHVLLVFALHVGGERLGIAEIVDDNGVVDDEVNWNERVDLLGVALEQFHAVTHGGQINHCGNAGEVLHQHAGGGGSPPLHRPCPCW